MRIPVLIAARNEQAEIGRTLAALDPATCEPVVITNGCTDLTYAVAKESRYPVIDLERPGKMSALQAGITYLGDRACEPFITLDADARPLLRRSWSEGMLAARRKLPAELPAVVVGGSVYLDKPSSVIRSARLFARQLRNSRNDFGGYFFGRNMLFDLGSEAPVQDMLALDELWPGEDVAMKDVVLLHGGHAIKSVAPATTVATECPRCPSLVSRLRYGAAASGKVTMASYLADAPAGSRPYPKTARPADLHEYMRPVPATEAPAA